MNSDYYLYLNRYNNFSHFSYFRDTLSNRDSISDLLEFIEDKEHFDSYEYYNEEHFENTVSSNLSYNYIKEVIFLQDTIHSNCGTINLCFYAKNNFKTQDIITENILYPNGIPSFIFEGFYEGSRIPSEVLNTEEALPQKMPSDFQFFFSDGKQKYSYNSETNIFNNEMIHKVELSDLEKENIYQAFLLIDFENLTTNNFYCEFYSLGFSVYWDGKCKTTSLGICYDNEFEPSNVSLDDSKEKVLNCANTIDVTLKKKLK
ncbi:MAG: hypothetical protein IPO21_04090 [Bacteroidales bacterium]|nr:hypothetical protein [Bacteroidales bacterium]